MNTPNDGGPAFPMPSGPEPRVDLSTHFNEGMSLRDYFAAAAMQGMAANHNLYLTFVKHRVPEAERMVSTERWVEIQQEFSRDLVASAFRTADAMLRAKGGAQFAEQAKLSVLVGALAKCAAWMEQSIGPVPDRDDDYEDGHSELAAARDAITAVKGGAA